MRRRVEMNRIVKRKLVEAKRQLRKNETGNALILLDQTLEICLRDECLKHGASTETKISEKPFSNWTIPDYLRFLDSKHLLTREQKSYFFRVHDWRNKVQHSGLEPKKEQVAESLKKFEPFIKCGIVCASVIMNKPVIGVELDDPLSKVVTLMKEHDYSQLPVFKEGKSVGSISEKTLLNFFEKYGKPPSPNLQVREITDKPFPQIKEDTPLTEILKHLRSNHGVLVTKEDRVVGIITKADLLKLI
jgi:predicted transcriptional regulator